MCAASIIKFEGDKKIENRIKRFLSAKQTVKGYEVGFIKTAVHAPKTHTTTNKHTGAKKAPTATVAMIAFLQEFGIPEKNVPERPFFRQANKHAETGLVKMIDHMLNAQSNYVLTHEDAARLGLYHEGQIKESITQLAEPPNKPATIKSKKSSNPLIDTGEMRRTVISKVVK